MFICLFLHQTTTVAGFVVVWSLVFICLFLHQTTTPRLLGFHNHRCLSVYSYIKPQLFNSQILLTFRCLSVYSYIKPQLSEHSNELFSWCLSVYSYIKPQRTNVRHNWPSGVYLSIPTSNHNAGSVRARFPWVFICLFLHQTTT